MNLLIVRHAIAEDREEFAQTGKDDSLRPLTDKGDRRMRRAAAGIKTCLPDVDVVATSPFARAVQTAAIVANVYGLTPIESHVLVPAAEPQEFADWLEERDQEETLVAVGHEPHLGSLVSWLLAGGNADFFGLKKGGACLLSWLQGERRAWLQWSLTPRQLRRIGSK